jgi:hypothetical protein
MPDSSNGNAGAPVERVYTDPATAALGERVSNQGRRLLDIETEMRAGFRSMESHIDRLATDTRKALENVTSNLAERNRPQWQALSVIMGFAVVLGGLAYWPIREATTDLKTSVATLAAVAVTREELDWRSARTAEDRARTEGAISDLRSTMLPRNEWMERNASRDHDIENIRTAQMRDVENLQRQIDLQRSDFQTFSNSLGNGRDVIEGLKEEIDRLREQLSDVRARQSQRLPPSS